MADQQATARNCLGFLYGSLDATAVPGPILVELMAALGVAEATSRQLLARMLKHGDLTRSRVGRVSVYRLAGTFLERYNRLRHGDVAPTWTGAFDTVVYDIPETERRHRDALLQLALMSGFGSVRPGLLIGFGEPTWLQALDPAPDTLIEHGRLVVELPTARRLAEAAWHLAERRLDLERLAEQVRAQLLAVQVPDDPQESLREQYRIVASGGRVRFSAPNLPAELQPDGWPAASVQKLLFELSGRFDERSAPWLRSVVAASPHASLLVSARWPTP